MPLIPKFNKHTPRASGALWWFAVLGGALAVAMAVRFFVNGGTGSSTTIEIAAQSGLGLLGLIMISFGLVNAFRSNLKEPQKGEAVLRINDEE